MHEALGVPAALRLYEPEVGARHAQEASATPPPPLQSLAPARSAPAPVVAISVRVCRACATNRLLAGLIEFNCEQQAILAADSADVVILREHPNHAEAVLAVLAERVRGHPMIKGLPPNPLDVPTHRRQQRGSDVVDRI